MDSTTESAEHESGDRMVGAVDPADPMAETAEAAPPPPAAEAEPLHADPNPPVEAVVAEPGDGDVAPADEDVPPPAAEDPEPPQVAVTPFVEAVEGSSALEQMLGGAVEQARAALVEFSGGDSIGEYLGASFEDSTSATHRFLADLPGYRGWQWAVVVAAYPGADHATISEVVLVPGPTALLAPQWVPWQDRVQPGDLSPGDLLAPLPEDPRLVPGHVACGDPEIDDIAQELGLGRRQVLSDWGRVGAAQRWHDGDFGPASAMARSTRRVCRDCGFYLPLAGSLGIMFGVCANALAADGRVVDAEYGCGAHSDTPQPPGTGSPLFDPYDDGLLDLTERA